MFLEMLSLSHLTTIHNTLSWCGFMLCVVCLEITGMSLCMSH